MASEQNRGGVGRVHPILVLPTGMIEEGDGISLSIEEMSHRQPGQTGAQDKNSLFNRSGHEDQERNQMLKAMANRWVVERLMRGPNT